MIAGNKKDNILNLRIYGFIGRGWFADASAEEINREIERYGKVDEIHVRIHSPGGSIAEGCAIYNSLKNNPAKVKVFIEGECCSIATVIAMAGDEIVMSPVANFMIHNPLVMYMSGGAEELRARADVLDKLKETIINAYATKSHLSREEISELMDKETYFTAEEALEKGFITEVLDLGEQNNSTSLGKYNYQHVPDNYFNLKIKNTENKEEEMDLKNVTLDQLRAENPELVNSIIFQERERIKGLDLWASKTTGAEDLIKKYKYEEPKNAVDVMEELLNYVGKTTEKESKNSKEEDEKLAEAFKNKKKDCEESGAGEIKNIDTKDLKEASKQKDIDDIVNLANNL